MTENYGACSFCDMPLTSDHNCRKSGIAKVGKPIYEQSHIIRFFSYDHLPESLQEVSRPFGILALQLDMDLPAGPEKSAGLRKLLEAKDCMVRAFVEAQ